MVNSYRIAKEGSGKKKDLTEGVRFDTGNSGGGEKEPVIKGPEFR